MLTNLSLNRLASSASVAVLTLGVAVGAQQNKVSAQAVGAGASSITTLAPFLRDAGVRYVVTGSREGGDAFQNGNPFVRTSFVATDGLGSIDPNDPNLIVLNEATLNVAFPYNPGLGPNLTLTPQQGCDIITGNVTNWSQVGGPNLAIRRVVPGDSSGTTSTINSGFVNPFCSSDIPNPPLPDGSDLPNARPTGSVDPISGTEDSDIVVAPNTDPFNSGDDNNPDNYSLGVINAILSNDGAVGYAETSVAIANGLPLATNSESGLSTIAAGPTYLVFRHGTNGNKFNALRNACRAGTDENNLTAAGFNVGTADNPGPERGSDTVPGGSPRCNNINPE